MRLKWAARRGVLALAVTAGIVGAAGVSVVLSESAGATPPKPSAAGSQSAHFVAMTVPTNPATAGSTVSAPPTTASASRLLASGLATAPGKLPLSNAPAPVRTQQARPMRQVQLAAPQLPGYSAERWVPVGTQNTRILGGHDIGENECAKVDGAESWTQQAFSGGGGQNVAVQDTFTFANAGAAQAAYQNVVTGMRACQQATRALQASNNVPVDATVTDTASQVEAAAWKRSWTGVMGMSAAGPQTNHLYMAFAGTSLIVLQFTEFPGHASTYDVTADPGVLSIIEAVLAR
jgi:hypothetical protein